jgi:putative Holliday junction resolvase
MMTPPNESRFLAIDYGEKRVGLALTDPLKIIASPFTTLSNDEKFVPKLLQIIREQKVSKIILGLPFCDNGTEARLGPVIRKFKDELFALSNVEIEFFDERYSSSIAEERIRSTVAKKSKRRQKSLIDMNAAAVILEDYLNSIS